MPQRCGRDYTKETGIFFQHSAALRGNGAKPEGTSLLWRHDNTANALFLFWRRQISRWRRRWYRQTGQRGRFLPATPSFFQCLPLHRFMLSSCTRIRLQCYYGAAAWATLWSFFLHDACQCAWRIAPIRFNNVSLYPFIFIPNMSGLLCPLLWNSGSRFANWVRAIHYTTRASRNEFSNVGAIEVGLHAIQVPNSCRKWHTVYILVLIHSSL